MNDKDKTIAQLREALRELMDATASHTTQRTLRAQGSAIRAYIDATPTDVQLLCLEIAQSRLPSVKTFATAIQCYGTMLIIEAETVMLKAKESSHAQD